MLEAIGMPTTPKKAPQPRRRELTQTDVAALLRFDADANQLHWLKAPRGKRADDTLAGCDLKRDGKVIGRVVSIQGVRYRHGHVVTLLQTGEWPEAKRGQKAKGTRRRKAPIAASAVVEAAPAPAPIPEIPADLPELTRAVIAAAKPSHRGWLFGMARR
ncbi:MAG: hypothetical protein KBA31_00215 [Alphaproteobacteria bacterium]|nr:hypothetical protein [Alphaproteobacteria bacterium]